MTFCSTDFQPVPCLDSYSKRPSELANRTRHCQFKNQAIGIPASSAVSVPLNSHSIVFGFPTEKSLSGYSQPFETDYRSRANLVTENCRRNPSVVTTSHAFSFLT